MAEKKLTKASDAPAKKTATRKKVVKATENGEKEVTFKEATPLDKSDAKKKRIIAVVLFVLAIAFEVLAVLAYFGIIEITFMNTLVMMVGALVLDLACVIAGSLLWKKANHIDPASEKNKVKFFLWNNMGLIVAAFAFIPFIILALTDKKGDKTTKTVAIIAACVALVIGSLFGIEWNPISEEQVAADQAAIEGTVYWTQWGTKYHTHDDCGSLNNSEEIFYGSVEEAYQNTRIKGLCKHCEDRDARENEEPEKGNEDEELEEEAA